MEDEEEKLEELKKFKRPREWKSRADMAEIQVHKYSEAHSVAEEQVNRVKRSVKEWVSEEGAAMLQLADNLPIRVSDMDKDSVKKELMKRCGEKEKYHYLWVSFRDDGMIVTIGRTSFYEKGGYGDLFDPFDIYGTGTQKLILSFLMESNPKTKELLKRLNTEMNTFTTYALLLPVRKEDTKIVNDFERRLGEYLTERYPVFNYYSHNW